MKRGIAFVILGWISIIGGRWLVQNMSPPSLMEGFIAICVTIVLYLLGFFSTKE